MHFISAADGHLKNKSEAWNSAS